LDENEIFTHSVTLRLCSRRIISRVQCGNENSAFRRERAMYVLVGSKGRMSRRGPTGRNWKGARHIGGACNLTSLWQPSPATCVSFAINQPAAHPTPLGSTQGTLLRGNFSNNLGHLRSKHEMLSALMYVEYCTD
jgi:hypothetical protein